jgi:hypothetical protein
MPQPPPEPPVARRLRVLRRRIAAATLATFVAAWLAVAALGKGGSTSTAPASPSPTTDTSGQNDGSAIPQQSSGEPDSQSSGDPGSQSSGESESQSSGQPGPLTTSQS